MKTLLKNFEKVILYSIILMLMVVLLLTTAELAWILVQDILSPPLGLIAIEQLLDLFGFFLLILIGLELLESVKAYLVSHVIHVEIVLEVALIAVARKAIVLDLETYSAGAILSIAALILATGAAIYLIKHTRKLGLGSPQRPIDPT